MGFAETEFVDGLDMVPSEDWRGFGVLNTGRMVLQFTVLRCEKQTYSCKIRSSDGHVKIELSET